VTPLASKAAAGSVAAILMLGLLYSGLRKGPSPSASAPTAESDTSATSPEERPYREAEDRLRDLLRKAREGDVPAYLAAFADPLRSRIRREAEERGLDRFALDLRDASASRKSHATYAPEGDGPDTCRIVVESVYPDRNERQTYRLERTESGWRVSSLDTVKAREPIARYGAPAGYFAPEGVPVQASDVVPDEEP
jgi:hypothetical protein